MQKITDTEAFMHAVDAATDAAVDHVRSVALDALGNPAPTADASVRAASAYLHALGGPADTETPQRADVMDDARVAALRAVDRAPDAAAVNAALRAAAVDPLSGLRDDETGDPVALVRRDSIGPRVVLTLEPSDALLVHAALETARASWLALAAALETAGDDDDGIDTHAAALIVNAAAVALAAAIADA